MAYTRETGLVCRSALCALLFSLVALADSNITWTNFGFYAEADGNGIVKVSTPTDWVSGPHSQENIELGDFFLEFPVTETDTHRHIGFGTKPSVSDHFSALDFSIRLEPNGGTAKAIGYRGDTTRFLTLVKTGDTLRIQVMHRTISIYHNGVHLADKDYPDVDVNYPTHVDTSLYSVGASFHDVRFGPHAGDAPAFVSVIAGDPDDGDNDYGDGDTITLTFDRDTGSPDGEVDDLFVFNNTIGDVYSGSWSDDGLVYTITIDDAADSAPPRITTLVSGAPGSAFEHSPTSRGLAGNWGGRVPTWRSITNIQDDSDTLNKVGPTSDWNAAAFGREAIVNLPDRYGYFEGRVPHDDRKVVLGLSDGGIAVKLQDIDFGLLAAPDRTLRVYESGQEVHRELALKAGDLLRIEVHEDGSIHYLHNDIAIYESTQTASILPLTPNVAIESIGGGLIDTRISLPNPLPPWTWPSSETVAEEATLNSQVAALDPEGEAVTVILLDDVDHGTLTLNDDGSYSYTADDNYFGQDSFSFRAEDPGGLSSGETWVTITVTNVNDRPTVPDERISHRAEAYPLNGFDVDGDPLTYTLWSFPHPFLEASVAIIGTNLVVDPADGFTGAIELDYTATDSHGLESEMGTLTIIIGWELTIEARNASVRRLVIGMDADGRETRHPPASPDDGALAYLGDNSPRATAPFTVEILPHAEHGSWELNVDASSATTDVVLGWNPDVVPDNGLFLLRNDTIINMARNREIIIPAGESHTYEIRYGLRAQDITIGIGWSLVSIPLDPLDADPAAIFSDIPGFSIFGWDGTAYTTVDDVEAGVGYWVHNGGQFPVTKEIIGHSNEGPQDLVDGWNLIGIKGRIAPGIESAFTNPETIEELWGYNSGVYFATLFLELGSAYWIFATLP